MKVVRVVDIASAPDRVSDVLCDVERWPEWTTTVSQVVRADTGRFGMGSRARVFQPKLRPALWTVSELAPGRGFSWVSRAPGLIMTADHAVEPTSAGSRVTLRFEVSGWLEILVRIGYGALIEAYVATEALSLKSHCEAPA